MVINFFICIHSFILINFYRSKSYKSLKLIFITFIFQVHCAELQNIYTYRARQKNGSQAARIFQARPGRSGKQQQEQNSRNLGTVFSPGPVYVFSILGG